MTTVDGLPILAHPHGSRLPMPSDPTVDSLRTAILGTETFLHHRVRAVIAGLGDRPSTGLTYPTEASMAPDLLRATIAALGHVSQ